MDASNQQHRFVPARIIDEMAKEMEGTDPFFEGTEKLLEIWFASSLIDNSNGDLRIITR